jgi:hypothetical protein
MRFSHYRTWRTAAALGAAVLMAATLTTSASARPGTTATIPAPGYANGSVTMAAAELRDKRVLMGALPQVVPGTGATPSMPIRASNNQWLTSSGRTSIRPAGASGELAADGTSYLSEPYLAYYAVFSNNESRVAWLGSRPFTADSIVQTDEWQVDFFGSPFAASKTPPGAVVTNSQNSIDVKWSTTVASNWYSAHSWPELDIMPTGAFSEIYQVRHDVSGTFQFGSSFYQVTTSASAYTW